MRGFLVVALLVAVGFTAWTWLRPYAWGVEPGARCKVVGCQVKNDTSYYWLDMHLKIEPGQTHDLMKPVRLVTETGREIEPADTTLSGTDSGGTTDLWFKFWLEPGDIDGPLSLRINDGALVIKANSGIPILGASNVEYFVTNRW